MPGSDTRFLIVTLAATYPDGSVGYVTGLLRRPYDEGPLLDFPEKAPRARDDDAFQILIDGMEALYHAEVGPAYAPQDFTFTLHEADGLLDLGFLMGPAYVARAGMSGTRRPNVSDLGVPR